MEQSGPVALTAREAGQEETVIFCIKVKWPVTDVTGKMP